jgi:hypothetical protein
VWALSEESGPRLIALLPKTRHCSGKLKFKRQPKLERDLADYLRNGAQNNTPRALSECWPKHTNAIG